MPLPDSYNAELHAILAADSPHALGRLALLAEMLRDQLGAFWLAWSPAAGPEAGELRAYYWRLRRAGCTEIEAQRYLDGLTAALGQLAHEPERIV